MTTLATRVSQVKPSPTLAIAAKAKAMKAAGQDVCGFGAGEPDFDTPDHIKAAAIQALHDGQTKYGPAAGLPVLREAIATKLQTENQLPYDPDCVAVTNGGKQSLFNLAMTLLQPGDEVILPAPYWVSYPAMIAMAEATAIVVKTEESHQFKLTVPQLEAAISPQTKLLVLNSPSNPTGAVYTRSELEAIAKLVVEHQLYVVSDEIYEKLIYDSCEHISIGSLGSDILQRTIVSSGFAKAYSMTGWRVGYLAGPKDIVKAAIALQSHSTSNVCTFAQYGALAALTSPHSAASVTTMLRAFTERREMIYRKLTAIPGITCPEPMGAFYVFPNISALGLSSMEFCDRLLEEYRVAAVPGLAFGVDECIRMSYATDLETIETGLDRLAQFAKGLKS
ncbi:MAG: pyridoxal phosphate-dependent aminotransferase [Cyanobacteria bacterium P01_F01_bin.33]